MTSVILPSTRWLCFVFFFGWLGGFGGFGCDFGFGGLDFAFEVFWALFLDACSLL